MINISKCNNGVFLKSASLEITSRPLHLSSCFDYGIYLTNSSTLNIHADAITGATYGTSLLAYNTPTTVLANKGSSIDAIRDARITNTINGVAVISNSTALIQDSVINAKAGITSSGNTISAILSQSSYVQSFDNSITGYGSLTGGTGSSVYRSSLSGVLVVESTTAQNLSSLGINNSGSIVVDIYRGANFDGRTTLSGDGIEP
jgi:hypothetical protein